MTVTSRSAGDLLTAASYNTKLEAPVLTSEIGDAQITAAKIADGQITAAKLATQPAARVYHTAAQAIPNTTSTALAFDSERLDTDTIHDPATNNSRLTRQTPGLYLITGHVNWAANGSGNCCLSIRLNGATVIASQVSPNIGAVNSHDQAIATLYPLAQGDYLELIVYQTSGGALDIQAAGNFSPEFAMTRLSP
ncbi:MAG TPA: hypothetical protein VHL09_17125 [Dehalococcoidia bacterium]|nr:hypothetical protein [Dehalococcoidia bacterium]